MSDKKITDLPDGGAVQSTDEFVAARSGGNVKIAGSAVGVPSPIPGPVTIAANAPEPALIVTNTGPIADLAVLNGDDAQYILDAEGLLTINSDLGAEIHLHGTSATHSEVLLDSDTGNQAWLMRDDLASWKDSSGATRFALSSDGFLIAFNTLPDPSGYDPGTCFLWFDDTPGSAKLKIRAKDSAGNIVAGEVPLT